MERASEELILGRVSLGGGSSLRFDGDLGFGIRDWENEKLKVDGE